MDSSRGDTEKCRRLEERLYVLSDAMRAFAEATTDSQHLFDTVARRVAVVIKDYCIVLLLSDDGRMLTPVAVFDPDPEALRRVRDTLLEPYLLDTHPVTRRVLESGEPFFAPILDLEVLRPPRTTARYFEFVQQMGLHSMLIVPFRVQDRSIGQMVLARFRRDSPPFDEHDLDLAQNLARHAALAISNARLLAEARRESVLRKRATDRLQILAEAAREFSLATYDYDRLLHVVACRLGELLGDMCVIRAITEDGEWLESGGAAYHRDPELLAATREVMLSSRQRVGEGISGRVAATGVPLLTPRIDPADYIASSEPKYRAFLERLRVVSSMTVPLLCRGKVVGIANLMRSRPDEPYTEDDLHLVQSVGDHAALAIGNARSYAAERAARDNAEQATNALRQAEARFARLSESGLLGIVVSNLSGRLTEVNDALLTLVGYSRGELLSGRVAWADLTPPEWHAGDARAIEQLTTSGIGGLREKEYIRKDGRRVPVLIGSAMLDGESKECISFVLDITERMEAQAAIDRLRKERIADAKFRGLLEAAPDAMVIIDDEGKIVFVNGQLERLFGHARAELIGGPIELLVPERFQHTHPSNRARYLRNASIRPMGAGLELYGRRKDGTEFPMDVTLSPLETEGGLLVSAAIRDITDRKNGEQQRANLAAIVEFSDDAIVGKTLAGVITSWNRGAEHTFGYSANEAVGQAISLIVPPGRETEESAILDHLAKGEVEQFDTVRRRKDGRDIDVSVTISPVRDAGGRVVGISKVARDITARKRAEVALARAKEAAEAASGELEAFSYSVAHDLRAPLRGMNGFAQVLLDEYADQFDAEGRDCLQEIRANAQKMGNLIDALLSLSRVTRSHWRPERIDLSALFRTTAAQLAAAEPARKVSIIVQGELSADADPQLTRALFDNLLGNAWKFTANTPDARIEFGATEDSGTRTLFIRDNGAGFDMAYASKLFAPFQRLHTEAEFAGTGIGLATVQRIVRRHGGRIWAEGKAGSGATFYFTLPSASGELS